MGKTCVRFVDYMALSSYTNKKRPLKRLVCLGFSRSSWPWVAISPSNKSGARPSFPGPPFPHRKFPPNDAISPSTSEINPPFLLLWTLPYFLREIEETIINI